MPAIWCPSTTSGRLAEKNENSLLQSRQSQHGRQNLLNWLGTIAEPSKDIGKNMEQKQQSSSN